MNNSLIVHNYLKQKEEERIQKLTDLIQEMEDLKTEAAWGAKYKVWSQRAERLLEQEFGQSALALFKEQHSVDVSNEGFHYEIDQRRILLENILVHKDEYVPGAAATPAMVARSAPKVEKKRSFLLPWLRDYWFAPLGVLLVGALIVYYVFGIGKPVEVSGPQQEIIDSPNSINTIGQTGGTNTIVGAQVTNQVVKATQDGENIQIDLSQLEHPYKSILYVARNGQVLASPESWILEGRRITLYGASSEEQFLVQYTY